MYTVLDVCYSSHYSYNCTRLLVCVCLSHPLSSTVFPSIGDDDSFPVVALEWDTEGSKGKAVLSTGTGLAEDISHPSKV